MDYSPESYDDGRYDYSEDCGWCGNGEWETEDDNGDIIPCPHCEANNG